MIQQKYKTGKMKIVKSKNKNGKMRFLKIVGVRDGTM